MIDREKFFQDECDTLFLTVNGNKNTPLVPAKALVRF